MPPIFVTGATGFLGTYFLKLANPRWHLRCLARNPPNKSNRSNIEWIKGDLSQDGPWQKSLKGCQLVVHLATSPLLQCEKDPNQASQLIMDGVHRLMETGTHYKISRWILISSVEVYGSTSNSSITEKNSLNPLSIYGFLKACADLYAQRRAEKERLQLLILRFSNLYGHAFKPVYPKTVLQLFAERILNDQPIILHASYRNSRDFLHVRDAARAICQAIGSPKLTGIINVASGRETTLKEAAQHLAKLAKKPLKIDFRPNEGRLRRTRVNIAKARNLLNFRSKVSLDSGLAEMLEDAYAQHLHPSECRSFSSSNRR